MIVYKLTTMFLTFLMLSCGSSKMDAQKLEGQLPVKEIYFQGWVAGIQGGGAGINVYVNLNKAFEEGLILEKIQFKTYEVPVEKMDDLSYVARINTGQNKREEINVENTDEEVKVNDSKINLKDKQAILFFKKEGKSYSKTIENVEEREMIAYPSMRKPTE